MSCPHTIDVQLTSINEQKCNENFAYWMEKFPASAGEPTEEVKELSKKVLPCHTFSYDSLKPIFGFDERLDIFNSTNMRLWSAKKRLLATGQADYDPNNIPAHMEESISLKHDVFLFAYHGIHNPYHRRNDNIPINPFGLFLKSDIEVLTCVHGSPWDVVSKNPSVLQDIADGNLDKYYLNPTDLRTLKAMQVKQIPNLKDDFWYYFGNPKNWELEKGYGKKLFETAGEFRYLNNIEESAIAAILWPEWYSDNGTINENLELKYKFQKAYPDISVVKYESDLYNNNWVLSLVDASFYSQLFYLKYGHFHPDVSIAKNKLSI